MATYNSFRPSKIQNTANGEGVTDVTWHHSLDVQASKEKHLSQAEKVGLILCTGPASKLLLMPKRPDKRLPYGDRSAQVYHTSNKCRILILRVGGIVRTALSGAHKAEHPLKLQTNDRELPNKCNWRLGEWRKQHIPMFLKAGLPEMQSAKLSIERGNALGRAAGTQQYKCLLSIRPEHVTPSNNR